MANVASIGPSATTTETQDPRSNVLPAGATRDEVDVHWHFNWSEGELSPSPLYTPFDQGLLGCRVRASVYVTPPEPNPRQVAAAERSRRVRAALIRLSPEHVSALARWAAPPMRYPDVVFGLFGRLSALSALTESFEEIGGSGAFIEACRRATSKRDKEDGTVNFLRHAARVKLEIIRAEAETILRDAFASYALARAAIDAEAAGVARRKRRLQSPKLVAVTERSATRTGAPSGAMARLLAKRQGD